MKQLISLLLIISITIISWASCAKSTNIQVNAIYYQSSSAIHSAALKPSLTQLRIDDAFAFTSNQSANKQHNFFELAIIFNEKLQQFIAFFTHFGEEAEEVASNDRSSVINSLAKNLPLNSLSSSNNPPTIKKCKVSS